MLYLLMPGTRCSLREALLCPGCQQQKRNRQGAWGQGDAPKINANLYRGKLFNLFFTLFLYALLCFSFRFLLSFIRRRRQQPAAQRQRPFSPDTPPFRRLPRLRLPRPLPRMATGKHFVFRLHNLAIFVP